MDGGVNVGRAKPEAAAAEMREMWIIFFGTSAYFGEIWKFISFSIRKVCLYVLHKKWFYDVSTYLHSECLQKNSKKLSSTEYILH